MVNEKQIKSSSDKSSSSEKFIGLPPLPVGPYEAYIPYSGWRAHGRFRHKLRQGLVLGKETVKGILVYVAVYFAVTQLSKIPIFGDYTVLITSFAFYCYLLLMMYPLIVAPTNIQIGEDGVRLHWVTPFGVLSSTWISWQTIDLVTVKNFTLQFYKSSAIELHLNREALPFALRLLLPLLKPYFSRGRDNNSQSPKLCFDINAITHEADLPLLLRAIKHYLPSGSLTDEVFELEEAKGQSFTKLWLDSLQVNGADNLQLSLTPLEPGDTVLSGQYEIVRRLAAGGQAVTYLAQANTLEEESQENLDQSKLGQVVLKEFVLPVRGGIEIRKRALENVEHEAKLLQKLNNERIVKLIDCFVDNQKAYLVLEYIDGKSLRKLVQDDGPVSEAEAIRLGIEMCTVLEYLHTLEPAIVHRDFTPENLLLRASGELALIDFNVAEQLESNETKTMVGKHCYVSPEQFRGKSTTQSDIYACGCTLYWLLTGADPEPISMSQPMLVRPHLNGELDAIVARATTIDVSKRFASAGDMRKELEAIQASAESATV